MLEAVCASMRISRILFPSLLCGAMLAGCKGDEPMLRDVSASSNQKQMDEARQQMELIPPPSKTRYMAVKSLTNWENPYLTVQGGMVTVHVTLTDANTSGLGEGGLLRPVGARRRDLNVRVNELSAALNAVPQNAWPYGRVVAVEEAHDTPVSARPEVRRNMEAVIKTLSDLGIVVYEWAEGGPGIR